MLSINLFFVIIVALIMDYIDKQHYYKCVDKHIYGYSRKDFQNKKVCRHCIRVGKINAFAELSNYRLTSHSPISLVVLLFNSVDKILVCDRV